MSSLGNLSLSWIGARFLEISQFGVLSTVLFAGLIFAGLSKAGLIDGYTLRHSDSHTRRGNLATRRALGAVLVFGLASAVGLLAVGVVTSLIVEFPPVALLLSLTVLPLVIQDGFRWLCYANADEGLALVSTVVWTGGTWVGVALLVALDHVTLALLVTIWAGSAGLGALVAMSWTRTWPAFRGAWRWWREINSIGSRSSLDFLLTQSVSMGGGLVVAAAAGPAAFGLVRLAQLPFAPIQVLVMGSIALIQPSMVIRVREGRPDTAFSLGLRVCAALAIATLGITVLVLVVPTDVMMAILGESWQEAMWLAALVSAAMLGSVVGACFGPFLRARGLLDFEVRWKAIASPTSLLLVLVGATVWGAAGGAVALAVGALLFSLPLAARARSSVSPTSARYAQ
ncbi:hypothetical protein [Actinomycetospora chlora]|uniref:hypothetical protein n=1 Tax=Actinomycetospora chlora TaxID=663608 RepID=UPI0031E5AFE3